MDNLQALVVAERLSEEIVGGLYSIVDLVHAFEALPDRDGRRRGDDCTHFVHDFRLLVFFLLVLFILALFSGASSEILQGAEGEVHQEDGFVDIVLDHLVTEVELGK